MRSLHSICAAGSQLPSDVTVLRPDPRDQDLVIPLGAGAGDTPA